MRVSNDAEDTGRAQSDPAEKHDRDYEAEERVARQRESHERERFRERERQRELDREDDLRRVHDAEHRHDRAYARDDDFSVGREQVLRSASRLAYAVTRAGTEVASGATQIFGDLVSNLAGAWLPYGQSRRRGGGRDDDYDRDDDRGYRGRGTTLGSGIRGRTQEVAWDVSDAIRDTADVVARSSDAFVRAFDDRDDDDASRGRQQTPAKRRRRGGQGTGGSTAGA